MNRLFTRRRSQPAVVNLDFSGRQADRDRDRREAEADYSLRSDSEYRELTGRLADGEEQRAKEHGRMALKYFLASAAIAGTTVAVDLGVAQLFGLQQLLLGEDIGTMSEGITHGVILTLGAIPAAVTGYLCFSEVEDQSQELQLARHHRR